MARTPVVKIINGHEWEVTPWPVATAKDASAACSDAQGNHWSTGRSGYCRRRYHGCQHCDAGRRHRRSDRHDKTPKLIKDMLFGTAVDNKDITIDKHFDNHFTANFAELYKGLAFVLEVNFSDFFELVAGNTGSQPAPASQKDKAIREG